MIGQQPLTPFILAHFPSLSDAHIDSISIEDLHDVILIMGDLFSLFIFE